MKMSRETIFTIDGVLKKKSFERCQGKRHVATEEYKEADARIIFEDMPHWGKINNCVKC